MALSPRESGALVASLTKNITIKPEGIEKLGNVLIEEQKAGRLATSNFSQSAYHPKSGDPFALDWLLVVDTLNFCFWHFETEPGWTVEGQSGYIALCAAVNRALKENEDFLNPKFYSTITEKELKKVLRGDTEVSVPLLDERLKCLHEVGTALLEKHDGSFKNLVESANNSAVKLLELIITNFNCFRDEAEYKGRKVGIYKRAQILIGDIWACFKNEGPGHFTDIDALTMFADYRVPQALLYFHVFEYSEDLLKPLIAGTILKNGDEEEVEIRACSIHAVELVKDYVNGKLKEGKVNSVVIDHFLWDFRRQHAREIAENKSIPFHKTYSIYY